MRERVLCCAWCMLQTHHHTRVLLAHACSGQLPVGLLLLSCVRRPRVPCLTAFLPAELCARSFRIGFVTGQASAGLKLLEMLGHFFCAKLLHVSVPNSTCDVETAFLSVIVACLRCGVLCCAACRPSGRPSGSLEVPILDGHGLCLSPASNLPKSQSSR